MIYVLLGMHKSGTTLVSRLLHVSGINMGESFNFDVSYDQGNKFEREATLELNNDILASHGINSIKIDPYGEKNCSAEVYEAMQKVVTECDKEHEQWGFKDPRTCLVYDCWKTILPQHHLILVYRDPEESWQRYRRDLFRRIWLAPVQAWNFLKTWCAYNENLLKISQETDMPVLFLEYGELMQDEDEINRLSEFVGKSLVDAREKKLYRHKGGRSLLLSVVSAARTLRGHTGHRELLRKLREQRLRQTEK